MVWRWSALFVLCLGLAWVVLHNEGFRESPHQEGDSPPDFRLQALDGTWLDSKDFHHKVRLISFWASWCEPCVVEMPDIVELYSKFKDQGFQVFAINVEEENAFGKVKLFVDRHHLGFPVLRDVFNEVAELYGISSLPHNFLVNKQNKIVLEDHGLRRWTSSKMLQQIEGLLAAKEELPLNEKASK